MEQKNGLLVNVVPAAAHLWEVPGFHPLRFLRRTASGNDGETELRMELRYKKLWFRLACPNGRLIHRPLRITDQVAVYEAMVFLNREDNEPISAVSVSKTKEETADGNFVKAAQDCAMDEALNEAGFGIQFCEVDEGAAQDGLSDLCVNTRAVPETPEKLPAPVPAAEAVAPDVKETKAADEPDAQAERQEIQPEEEPPEAAPQPPAPDAAGIQEKPAAPAEVPAVNQAVGITAALDMLQVLDSTKAPKPKQQEPEEQARPVPTATLTETDVRAKFTAEMSVEDICSAMTLEEAGALVVSAGINKGLTMAEVAERRAASLKFYAYLDGECDNLLKAAALLFINERAQMKAG